MIELKDLSEDKNNIVKKGVGKKNFIKFHEDSQKDNSKKLEMMKNDFIWKGFPLNDRLWYSLCCKCQCTTNLKSKDFPIDDFLNNPSTPNENINFLNKIVFMKINKTGNLQIEQNIVHPYVKVSFIDISTLRYLQKTDFQSNAFNYIEQGIKACHNKTLNAYEFKEGDLDYIYPISTGFYDLRDKGETFAEWNEPFLINEPAENIYKNSTVIFFELFDFNLNPVIDSKIKNNMNHDVLGFNVPIAWGYLKPVGYSQTYLGKFKIQLYKYKYERPKGSIEREKGVLFARTPDVLFEFNWIKREMYESFLEVELHLENKPDNDDINNNLMYQNLWKYKLSAFYKEGDDNFNLSTFREEQIKKHQIDEDEPDEDKIKKNKYLLKIIRHPDEPCMLPNKLMHKYSSDKLGCLTLKFSPNGKYLAAACTGINSNTTIKIFNVLDMEQRYHFIGHSEIIHSLEWSSNSRILISASADFKVKVWLIPGLETSNSDNLEYLDNDKLFLLTTLEHSSYVYSTAIITNDNKTNSSNDQYKLLLATACADGFVRVYLLEFHNDDLLHQYRFYKSALIYEYNIAIDYMEKDFSKANHSEIKKKIKYAKAFNNTTSNNIDDFIQNLNPEKETLLNPTILDKRFPNSLVVDDKKRLYAGDSLGVIHIWDITVLDEITINKVKSISHRKLDGDEINCMVINPQDGKKVLIHSRDNSIRLINPFSKSGKISIENEYKGLKSQSINIKSCISPDGQYILSGNEEGFPKLWYLETGFMVNKQNYFESRFIDSVTDVSWNNHYNMVALSGFSQEYPILVFVYEKEDKEIEISNAIRLNKFYKSTLEIDAEHEKHNDNDRLINI